MIDFGYALTKPRDTSSSLVHNIANIFAFVSSTSAVRIERKYKSANFAKTCHVEPMTNLFIVIR